ncbi:VOC family protein [Salipiger abyssi]|uniref:VOC family protein n=1 Tax=Salipiger abyssi TaxID=1250539 RepID=UPI0040598ED6
MLEIADPIFKPDNQNSVVKPLMMTHGTMECRNLTESRKFLEEFLGMECVRHNPDGMHARCGMKFSIVCIQTEKPGNTLTILNHWGLDVESKEAVDEAHKAAHEMKDKYKIKSITDPIVRHGIYSFYLEDLDGNFWEIEYYDGGSVHEDAFDFGDQYEDV